MKVNQPRILYKPSVKVINMYWLDVVSGSMRTTHQINLIGRRWYHTEKGMSLISYVPARNQVSSHPFNAFVMRTLLASLSPRSSIISVFNLRKLVCLRNQRNISSADTVAAMLFLPLLMKFWERCDKRISFGSWLSRRYCLKSWRRCVGVSSPRRKRRALAGAIWNLVPWIRNTNSRYRWRLWFLSWSFMIMMR